MKAERLIAIVLLLLVSIFSYAQSPSITSLSPTSGKQGTSFTITGTGFGATQGSGKVMNESLVLPVTSWSDTAIVATMAPAGGTWVHQITVVQNGVASTYKPFTVAGAQISSISPTSGPVGTQVTITGTNFGTQYAGGIAFPGNPAPVAGTVTSWSDTEIVVTVPAGAFTGTIYLMETASYTAAYGPTFTVEGIPSITSLSPTSGKQGTAFTITGTGFGATQGTGTVMNEGSSLPVTTWSDTQIAATMAPAGPTWAHQITVVQNGITSNYKGFSVAGAQISSISPTSGPTGTQVTITGTNFGTQYAGGIKFAAASGTVAGTVTSWSDTEIVVTVPTGAITGTTYLMDSATLVAVYGPTFTVVGVPTITSLSPTSGKQGTVVTITGTGFGSTQGSGTVMNEGSSLPVTSWSDTSIVATMAPAGGTWAHQITVVQNGITSNYKGFSVAGAQISSISPTSGPVGTQVTITGTNFGTQFASGIKFAAASGVVAGTVTNWSDAQIVVTVPTGSITGTVHLMESPTLTVVNGPTFTVVPNNAPQVSITSPTGGSSFMAGTNLTITASASDSDGNIAKVEFFDGTTKVGETSSSPYSLSWTATPTGIHYLTAKATDNSGGVTTSTPVGIVVVVVGNWFDQDIGVAHSGTATYTNGAFALQSSGNRSGTSDAAHFVYQPIAGDGMIVARLVSTQQYGNAYAGVMMRESLDANAKNMSIGYDYEYPWDTHVSYRTSTGGSAIDLGAAGGMPVWLKLTRNGSTFTASWSADGLNWWQVTSQTISMTQTIYVGLMMSQGSAVLDNVSVDSIAEPAPAITGVSATTAPVGGQVDLMGLHFGTSQGNSSVVLNGSPVTVNSWSDTSITITIPAGATSGYLTVCLVPSMNNSNPIAFTVTSQPLPSGFLDQDIGVAHSGTASYTNGTFTLQSTGYSLTSDAAHYVYQPMVGDGTIIARLVNTQSNGYAYAGVMMRETLDANAKSISVGFKFSIYYNILTEYRTATDGPRESTAALGDIPMWLKLVRIGNNFIAYKSLDAVSWSVVAGPVTIPMEQNIYVGLMAQSGSADLDNVSTTTVADPSPVITNTSRTSAPIGGQLDITGQNFGSAQGSSLVVLNGTPLTVTSWADNSIAVTVPAGASSGYLTVLRAPTLNSSNPVGFTVTSQPLPVGWFDRDLGGISPGTASYSDGTFAIQGTQNISGTTDALHFVYRPFSTDGVLIARVTSGTGGIMVRPTLDAASPEISLLFSSYFGSTTVGQTSLSYRTTVGGDTSGVAGPGGSVPYSLKLVRVANSFTAYTSPDGANWTQLGATQSFTTGQTVYVGLVGANVTIDGVEIDAGATLPNPVIASLSSNTGAPGGLVTINGSGFGGTLGTNAVQFNGIAAAVNSWSDNQIEAYVPDAAITGPVSVIVGNITAQGPTFTIRFSAQVTDSLGNVSNYHSSMSGGTWMVTSSDGSGCSTCTTRGVHQNQFDGQGNLAWSIDELGRAVSYRYDSSNNLISESVRVDSNTFATSSYTYNSMGQVLTATDPLGHTTTNEYDTSGNLLKVTSPVPNENTTASITQFRYDTKGELNQITDPLNHVTTIAYNTVGLIESITDANSKSTTYEYDPHGNRTAVVDALSHRTEFAYDTGDRLTTIMYPDSTTTTFGYDTRGRRTTVTDPNGKITTYAYDDADRLKSVIDAATNETHYAYDNENNLLSITDALGRATSFHYDAFGRVTETDFPSSYSETYGYDSIGNLTSKTDRKGQTILYVYDALNRLTHKGYPDSTGVDYVYDLVGKIQSVNDPSGTYGFAYDNMGRLVGATTEYAFLTGHTYTNAYAYDKASNRTGYTDPAGSTVAYGYDTLNRMHTLNSSLAGNFTFNYDDLSRRTSLARPNGVVSNYAYDNLSRLLSVLHEAGGTTTIDGASYTYDDAGNRLTKTNQLNGTTDNYAYDNIYQLTQVTQGTTTTESYSYDAVGNRLSSLGASPYTVNSSNQLTSTPSTTFTYDHNGNTLTKTASNGTTTYAWDYENRLTSVTLPGTGGTVTFQYDPFGRRIQKSGPSGTTNYVYDGANGVEEVNASATVTAHYVQGAGIDEPLAQSAASSLNFYSADGLGSITSMTDGTGTPSATFVYGAFGVLSTSSGTVANAYRYTAREFDSETGLYYYRARYYDPEVGRFLSSDPIGFQGGLNFYSYVGNEVANLIDPSGLAPSWLQNLLGGPTPPPPSPPKPPPLYNPRGWDESRHNNNCYSYACDRLHPSGRAWSKPQPGGATAEFLSSCGGVRAFAHLDGVLDANSNGCCPPGYHRVKLYFSHSLHDYHWYRQDSNGGWSSKHGWEKVGPQVDPAFDAFATFYDEFCGDMCAKNQ